MIQISINNSQICSINTAQLRIHSKMPDWMDAFHKNWCFRCSRSQKDGVKYFWSLIFPLSSSLKSVSHILQISKTQPIQAPQGWFYISSKISFAFAVFNHYPGILGVSWLQHFLNISSNPFTENKTGLCLKQACIRDGLLYLNSIYMGNGITGSSSYELRPCASFKTTVCVTYATSHAKAVILKNKLDLKN